MSFLEESSGTNAIDIAIRLGSPVFTLPQQNYCNFLRTSYFYATPLWFDKRIACCLAVTTQEQAVKNEMMAVIELLGYQITNEFKKNAVNESMELNNSIKLNGKQLTVLKLLSKGLTDKAVAIDIGISIDTVRYHKRVIFEKLDAGSSVGAIVKALKLNLIAIDEIEL